MWLPHSCTAVPRCSSLLCALSWGRNRSHGIRERSSGPAVSVHCQNTSPEEGRQGFQSTAGFARGQSKLLPGSSIVCQLQGVGEGEEMGSDRSTLWVASAERRQPQTGKETVG